MITAAQERAALSARRLPKKYGNLLQRWAGARRRAWGINEAWTTTRIATFLDERRRSGVWEPLSAVMEEIADLDKAVRLYCQVFPPPREWRERATKYLADHEGPELGVADIHDAMKKVMPSLTREKVRKVLVRANRNHELSRVKRGRYVRTAWNYRRWEELRRWSEDPVSQRAEARYEQRRYLCTLVFLSHYLLPTRASYRKARDLNLGDRTYFNYLALAIESMLWDGDWRKRVQSLFIVK